MISGLTGSKKRETVYDSSPDEWVVSYHGTSYDNGVSIAQMGFDLTKGQRFAYGRGIYSSPSVDVAAAYVQTMIHNGVRYSVIISNDESIPLSFELLALITIWCLMKKIYVLMDFACEKLIQFKSLSFPQKIRFPYSKISLILLLADK